MFRRFASVCAALATMLTVVAGALTIVTASASPAAAAGSVSGGTGLLALRNGDLTATNPSSYGVIVMNAWEYARIPAIKAANPGAKVLVYKDMSSTRSYAVRNGADDALLPSGLGYAAADNAHPDWFLTDQNGRRIEWVGYPGHWWMDVGNESYTDAWINAVTTELVSHGWDGVMIDNAMTSAQWYLPSGVSIPKYPTDEAFVASTDRFLSVAGPRLRAAGLFVAPNFGGNTPNMAQYRRWVGFTGGAEREYFGRWGLDGNGNGLIGWDWSHELEQQEAAQAAGLYLAVAYGRPTDVDFMRYARSSFLIGWDGGASSLLYTSPTAGVNSLSSSAWTTDIGLPAAGRYQSSGAWLRRYTGGITVANPSASTLTVPLGAAFVTPEGATVTSITLGSARGMVLSNGAGTPAPAPVAAPTVVAGPGGPPAGVTAGAGRVATAGVPSGNGARGYWVLGADGGVFSYGTAKFQGSLPGLGIRNRAVTMAATPSGNGYWLLGGDGGIFSFGDAGFFGSVPGLRLPGNVTAIDLQPTPSGNGYWILGADGGIFSFGDAAFAGSVPGLGIRNRAVKIAPTTTGNGYWILGEDGGVFSFGDARFFGSLPGIKVRNRSIALAPTPSGNGYWLLGADGGIFAFGDATFHGSVPGLGVRETGVQMRPTLTGAGYYVLSQRGEVFAFGDAPSLGSPAALGIRGQDLAVI
jgi:hypothetical protein